jgi:topoisomerase (DNA) II binding protein 1
VPTENSSNDENVEASVGVKTPALHEATPEKGCAIFPYVNSEVRKESSGVSLQNRKTDMSDAEQVYKVDVAALGLESDKAAPHQSLEASPGDIPVNAVIGKDSKTHAKASTSRVKCWRQEVSRCWE